MKQLLCCVIILTAASTRVRAQLAQADAKGKTSIILTNSNINIDIAESSLDMKWNNFNQRNYNRMRATYWGLSASGKLEDGITNIWNDGNIATSSSIDGFIALRRPLGKAAQISHLIRMKEAVRKQNHTTDSLFKAYGNMQKIATDVIAIDTNYSRNRDELTKTSIEIINAARQVDYMKYILAELSAYQVKLGKDSRPMDSLIIAHVKDSLSTAKHKADSLLPAVAYANRHIRKLNDSLNTYTNYNGGRNIKGSYVTWYLHGGMTGNMYELYDSTIAGDLNNRFVKTNFRGGFIDVGFNLEATPSFIFGFSAGYEYANTIDSLDKQDYSVKNSVNGTGQSLSSEKKHTAYTGLYEQYNRVNFKQDALRYYTISDDYQMIWNIPYTRWYIPIDKPEVKFVANLGTSLTFFKQDGQFAGGVYVEARDLFNNVLDKSFGERLQFGLTATFSFKSIVNRFVPVTDDAK